MQLSAKQSCLHASFVHVLSSGGYLWGFVICFFLYSFYSYASWSCITEVWHVTRCTWLIWRFSNFLSNTKPLMEMPSYRLDWARFLYIFLHKNDKLRQLKYFAVYSRSLLSMGVPFPESPWIHAWMQVFKPPDFGHPPTSELWSGLNVFLRLTEAREALECLIRAKKTFSFCNWQNRQPTDNRQSCTASMGLRKPCALVTFGEFSWAFALWVWVLRILIPMGSKSAYIARPPILAPNV